MLGPSLVVLPTSKGCMISYNYTALRKSSPHRGPGQVPCVVAASAPSCLAPEKPSDKERAVFRFLRGDGSPGLSKKLRRDKRDTEASSRRPGQAG